MTDNLDAQSAFSGTREVDERYRLDEAALDVWLSANVESYAGPLTIRQFKGGQSNPTYELTTPGRTYVLRRKPPGTLLASAHAVDREFTVISALHAQGFPVAQPYALCADEAIIGSIFYVMDKVEGFAIDATGSGWLVTDNDGVDDSSGETFLWSVGALR